MSVNTMRELMVLSRRVDFLTLVCIWLTVLHVVGFALHVCWAVMA